MSFFTAYYIFLSVIVIPTLGANINIGQKYHELDHINIPQKGQRIKCFPIGSSCRGLDSLQENIISSSKENYKTSTDLTSETNHQNIKKYDWFRKNSNTHKFSTHIGKTKEMAKKNNDLLNRNRSYRLQTEKNVDSMRKPLENMLKRKIANEKMNKYENKGVTNFINSLDDISSSSDARYRKKRQDSNEEYVKLLKENLKVESEIPKEEVQVHKNTKTEIIEELDLAGVPVQSRDFIGDITKGVTDNIFSSIWDTFSNKLGLIAVKAKGTTDFAVEHKVDKREIPVKDVDQNIQMRKKRENKNEVQSRDFIGDITKGVTDNIFSSIWDTFSNKLGQIAVKAKGTSDFEVEHKVQKRENSPTPTTKDDVLMYGEEMVRSRGFLTDVAGGIFGSVLNFVSGFINQTPIRAQGRSDLEFQNSLQRQKRDVGTPVSVRDYIETRSLDEFVENYEDSHEGPFKKIREKEQGSENFERVDSVQERKLTDKKVYAESNGPASLRSGYYYLNEKDNSENSRTLTKGKKPMFVFPDNHVNILRRRASRFFVYPRYNGNYLHFLRQRVPNKKILHEQESDKIITSQNIPNFPFQSLSYPTINIAFTRYPMKSRTLKCNPMGNIPVQRSWSSLPQSVAYALGNVAGVLINGVLKIIPINFSGNMNIELSGDSKTVYY